MTSAFATAENFSVRTHLNRRKQLVGMAVADWLANAVLDKMNMAAYHSNRRLFVDIRRLAARRKDATLRNFSHSRSNGLPLRVPYRNCNASFERVVLAYIDLHAKS